MGWDGYCVMYMELSDYSLISAVKCLWKIMQRLEYCWFDLWYSVSGKKKCFSFE